MFPRGRTEGRTNAVREPFSGSVSVHELHVRRAPDEIAAAATPTRIAP